MGKQSKRKWRQSLSLDQKGEIANNLRRKMDKSSMLIKSRCLVDEGELIPMIDMKWGNEEGSLNVNEAIKHGLVFMEAAIASLTDALLIKFFVHEIKLEMNEAISILREYRMYRKKHDNGSDLYTQQAINLLIKSEKEQTEEFLKTFSCRNGDRRGKC